VKKPLHGGTKHSKLSATIYLYNLKCVGGLSNTIFSALLEFIIQLLPASVETLPVNTYKAKKFLRDMGLGYSQILVCRNDCMLFRKKDPVKVLRWFPNEHQGGPSLKDPLQVLDGPITRLRAKEIKEAMQGLV